MSLESSELAPVVPASGRSALVTALRFIHDRNPFYLLSALCMFIGFRLTLGALNSAPGDWKTLLGLIVTLQFYEMVMIALALFLIVRRGLRRDGWILLGMEALFMLDLTNLNAELFTAMPRMGSIVNGICFLLAIGKVLVICRSLGLKLSPTTTIYIAAQLAFLFGLPGIFRLMRSPTATISPMQIYSIWWMLALLIGAGGVLVKQSSLLRRSPMGSLPFRLYILLPLISLLVHLCSENRVYWVHFHYANLAPVLLAMVVVLNQSKLRWHRNALQWSLGLIAIATLLSIVPPGYQHDLASRIWGVTLSPLRMVLIASAGLSIWIALRHSLLIAAAVATGCLSLAVMGANIMEIDLAGLRLLRAMVRMVTNLIPQTAVQWGCAAIAFAFLLLGIGAMVSLKASVPTAKPEPSI